MRTAIYYLLMLLLGFFWYRLGQKLLRKNGRYDENGKPSEGFVGPVGFLMCGVLSCCLVFAVFRALIRGEIPCVGKACSGQVYSLATNAGAYWANLFFVVWLALAMGYAMYVTFKVWFAPPAQ